MHAMEHTVVTHVLSVFVSLKDFPRPRGMHPISNWVKLIGGIFVMDGMCVTLSTRVYSCCTTEAQDCSVLVLYS